MSCSIAIVLAGCICAILSLSLRKWKSSCWLQATNMNGKVAPLSFACWGDSLGNNHSAFWCHFQSGLLQRNQSVVQNYYFGSMVFLGWCFIYHTMTRAYSRAFPSLAICLECSHWFLYWFDWLILFTPHWFFNSGCLYSGIDITGPMDFSRLRWYGPGCMWVSFCS